MQRYRRNVSYGRPQQHISIQAAAELTDRSTVATARAVQRLEAAGVLNQVTLGRRNRAWECVGLFSLVDRLEQELSGGALVAGRTQ